MNLRTRTKVLEEMAGAKAGAPKATRERLSVETWFVLVVVALLLTFVVYSASIGFQFVYDDAQQIVKNPAIGSLRNLPQYFTHHLWYGLTSNPDAPGNYYRPLFQVWLLINHSLFGLKPWGWHLAAILAHILVTALVFVLALRTTGDRNVAVVASFVFGLHPLHIESVAWVSGVTDPLMAIPFLSSFLLYLGSRKSTIADALSPLRSKGRLALSLLLYAGALLCKETAIVFPPMVFAWELLLGGGGESSEAPRPESNGARDTAESRSHKGRLRSAATATIPYLVVTALYLVARVLVLKGLNHRITTLSPITILLTWPSLLARYIRTMVWPFGLSIYYDTPYVTGVGVSSFVLPSIGVAVVASGLVWVSRQSRVLAFYVFWLVAPILPLLNISIFARDDLAHDRYLYLSSVAAAIMVGIGVSRLRELGVVARMRPRLKIFVAGAAICAMGITTAAQSLSWADNLVLFYRASTIAPRNAFVLNNLANELFDRARYDDALALYQQNVTFNPDSWLANYNLGHCFYRLNRFQDSCYYLQQAVRIDDSDPDQFIYLGLTLNALGRAPEAASAIRHALNINPGLKGYHLALGFVLEKGDPAQALAEYRIELASFPDEGAASQRIEAMEFILNQLRNKAGSSPSTGGR